jgi:hypothetical protein
VDNRKIFDSITLRPDAPWSAQFDKDLLTGVVRITDGSATYVPYYTWDNRDPGKMKVWVSLAE